MRIQTGVYFKDLKIVQNSYVYRDVRRHAKLLEDMYNVPKFSILEMKGYTKFRGKKEQLSIKIAHGYMFGLNVDLIEWIDGECSFKEFLDAGKEGFHHIGVLVEDYEGYLAYSKEVGIEVIQYGRDATRWAYLATEESIGVILELIEVPKGKFAKETLLNYFFISS